MIKRAKAIVSSHTQAEDKETGRRIEGKSKSKQTPFDFPESKKLGVIKAGASVKLAYGYQSAGVEVGIELPWVCETREGIKNGFKEAYEMLDEELAERAKELDPLLRELAKKYGHK